MSANMPAAEVDIDAAFVRALLFDQHPDLADLDIRPLANGWDNAIFRLGEDLVVRLPRRELAAPLILNEQRWLPELARHLPLPIPAPVRKGVPADGYPWHWSICPWLPGAPATEAQPDDLEIAARTLGLFVGALHTPAPADAPANPYRGVALAERDASLRERVAQLDDLVDGPAVLELWASLAATAPWPGPKVWLHGDLHAANVLVLDGRLSAVIDFGDLTAGDPATDLAVAWMLFPPALRPTFRAAAGEIDDATWARARAWALVFAIAYLANSADNPPFAALGRRTLSAVLA